MTTLRLRRRRCDRGSDVEVFVRSGVSEFARVLRAGQRFHRYGEVGVDGIVVE